MEHCDLTVSVFMGHSIGTERASNEVAGKLRFT